MVTSDHLHGQKRVQGLPLRADLLGRLKESPLPVAREPEPTSAVGYHREVHGVVGFILPPRFDMQRVPLSGWARDLGGRAGLGVHKR